MYTVRIQTGLIQLDYAIIIDNSVVEKCPLQDPNSSLTLIGLHGRVYFAKL